jgi:hypothetical protein
MYTISNILNIVMHSLMILSCILTLILISFTLPTFLMLIFISSSLLQSLIIIKLENKIKQLENGRPQ